MSTGRGTRTRNAVFGVGIVTGAVVGLVASGWSADAAEPEAARVVAVESGAVASGAAQAAAAGALSLDYRCSVPGTVDGYGVTVDVDADVPDAAEVGQPTPAIPVTASLPLSEDVAGLLRRVGVTAVSATATAEVTVAAPQGELDLPVTLEVPETAVPESGSFHVVAEGTAEQLTFDEPGTAEVRVGDLAVTAVVTWRDGDTDEFDATCALADGQDNVVASLDVTGTGDEGDGWGTQGVTSGGGSEEAEAAGAGEAADGDGAADPGGTSGTAGADGTGGAAGGKQSAAPDDGTSPAGVTATTGSDGIQPLALVGAGVLVAGGICVAVAVYVRRSAARRSR